MNFQVVKKLRFPKPILELLKTVLLINFTNIVFLLDKILVWQKELKTHVLCLEMWQKDKVCQPNLDKKKKKMSIPSLSDKIAFQKL
jgi:hypothetical protein